MREKMEEMRRQMENTICALREQLKNEIESVNIHHEHEASLVPVGKRGLRRRVET
jgi:hypothetical protein